MKAKQFENDFDAGKDLTKGLDLSKARRVKQTPKRANADLHNVDGREARQRGEATCRHTSVRHQDVARRAAR